MLKFEKKEEKKKGSKLTLDKPGQMKSDDLEKKKHQNEAGRFKYFVAFLNFFFFLL